MMDSLQKYCLQYIIIIVCMFFYNFGPYSLLLSLSIFCHKIAAAHVLGTKEKF